MVLYIICGRERIKNRRHRKTW